MGDDGRDLPVVTEWFEIVEIEPGVHRMREPHVHRLMRANLFLVRGRERDLLFDSGMGIGRLREALAPLLGRPLILFTSHSHADHAGGHPAFEDAEILVHPAEAALLEHPTPNRGLSFAAYPPDILANLASAGFAVDGYLVDAVPEPGWDPDLWTYAGVRPSRLVDEGCTVDLGDRRFQVLHLPGHSPGSIGLWDAADGMLLAGDAIYDGILIDDLPGGDPAAYRRTMRRLMDLPVRIVHGGHRESFGRERLIEIAGGYLARDGGAAGGHAAGDATDRLARP